LKICFIYDNWDNDKTLNVYRKMTPNRSGKWKDMVAITNPDEADFQIIIDYTKRKIDPKKAIYISAHPTNQAGYYDPKPEECVASINYKTTSGFLEWWLKYDYDELSKMECPEKTKLAACIMRNITLADYQKDRVTYMDKFNTDNLGLVDMFGRETNPLGNEKDYWFGKEILADYKHSLEFDAYAENYFSERIADSLLMWCKPIYKGGWGVEKYIPKNSFAYLDDINLREYLISDDWEKSIKDISEARDLILNKLQVWAKVYDCIKAL